MILTEGTVTFEGDNEDYEIRIQGVDEYGNTFSGTHRGEISIRNPFYDSGTR
jgi:hypothetical protein